MLLERMYEKCDPMVFCHQIRPFYAGSKVVSSAGLRRSVLYDEGQGTGQWMQLPDWSNGQSSLLQLFDMVLGTRYNKNSSPSRRQKGFFFNTRECTPGSHRRFLALLEDVDGNILELCLEHEAEHKWATQQDQGGGGGGDGLWNAYVAATNAMARFRSTHIQIVTRYIALPIRQS